MRPRLFLLLKAIVAVTVCIGAHVQARAQEAACRLTQTMTVAGQKISTDQCLQNRGLPAPQFKTLCSTGSEGVPALGIAPMKINYLAACPTASVNVCDGFAQGKLTTYYYNKEDGPERKQGCEASGGKFK